MAISFAQRVTVPDEVLAQELDGEMVLLNLTNEGYYGLDLASAHMWKVLTNSPSIQDAFESLLGEYNIEAEELRADLQSFLENLVQNGLVQVNA